MPLLVGNIGPATFGKDDNALLLVSDHEVIEFPRASKTALAAQLITYVSQRLAAMAAS